MGSRFEFCTPCTDLHNCSARFRIDDKNERNYLHARLNWKRKSFTAQYKEGASSLTADALSFFCASQILIPSGILEETPFAP